MQRQQQHPSTEAADEDEEQKTPMPPPHAAVNSKAMANGGRHHHNSNLLEEEEEEEELPTPRQEDFPPAHPPAKTSSSSNSSSSPNHFQFPVPAAAAPGIPYSVERHSDNNPFPLFPFQAALWISILALIVHCFQPIIGWPIALCLMVAFLLIWATDTGRRIRLTLARDLRGLFLLIRVKLEMRLAFRLNQPIHRHFLRTVARHPDKVCLIERVAPSRLGAPSRERQLTFAQFNARTNQYGNMFKNLGYRKDTVLALFMENGVEFFAAWLGCSKLGVVTAWINSNLKMEPLAHSVRISGCQAVMTTRTLLPVLLDAVNHGLLPVDLTIFIVKNERKVLEAKAEDIAKAEGIGKAEDIGIGMRPPNSSLELIKNVKIHLLDNDTECESPSGLTFQSVLCYIYTSGTTGHPKAAIIKHYRYFLIGCASSLAFDIRASDRLYLTLPMYHSTGGILGTSQVLIRGCSAFIRPKFSASAFWEDCTRFECTVAQYVGEICRYLLAQRGGGEEDPWGWERRHRIRLMFGNGLRPEIWRQFVHRFGIQRIGEFYGSTEGNSNLVNIDNHVGSCGFITIYTFLHMLYPLRLLKVDEESGELVRDARGFCVKCQPGDTGEMVATIKDDDLLQRFEGYLSKEDTQKKIIRDCCAPGDTVFASGDILHWDRLGYMYFKDRRGDTYRWKGENVSTTEVEAVLQPLPSILDATVYGVEIPGREGRAGMVACTLKENDADHPVGKRLEDFIDELSTRVSSQLAAYAIPVFLRLCDGELDKTGTFKLKKSALQRDGFDLRRCGVVEDEEEKKSIEEVEQKKTSKKTNYNKLFYWDSSNKRYEPLTAEMQARIESGEYSKI